LGFFGVSYAKLTLPEAPLTRWKNEQQTSVEVQRLKRAAVLKEAARAFGQRGYHNTSLDDVAKALRVAKGTLYNYIKDKQEILFECHNQAYEIGEKAIELGQVDVSNGAERLTKTAKCYIRFLIEQLGACSVLMEIDALRPKDRAKVVERRDGFQRQIVDIVRAGIADGSLAATNPNIVVFTFMGAANWIPRWYSTEGKMSGEEIAEQMTELLMSGLRIRPDGG
jgi:AcrR family transcriptional regulator